MSDNDNIVDPKVADILFIKILDTMGLTWGLRYLMMYCDQCANALNEDIAALKDNKEMDEVKRKEELARTKYDYQCYRQFCVLFASLLTDTRYKLEADVKIPQLY